MNLAHEISLGVATAFLQLKDDGFFKGIKDAEGAMKDLGETSTDYVDKMKSYATGMTTLGDSMTRNVTIPIVRGAKDVINTYRDMESAFTGVKKTIDDTKFAEAFGDSVDGWEVLDNAIREISQSTASTYEEVAAVMEWAGQLNVPLGKGGESIKEFTRVMIELGDSTNLTAEESAEAIAKLMNIMGTDTSQVRNLGSAIVDLGNNSATTERDIVEMSMRIAGAGAQIGLTEQEVLGIATALSSVGIRAEMGGSAISKAMVKMQVAVETGYDQVKKLQEASGMTLRDLELMSTNDTKSFKKLAQSLGMTTTEIKDVIKAGNNLNDFASIANMSTEEFVKLYRDDSVEALEAFITGLGDTETHGESAIAMLDEMGFREVRLRDTLLRVSGAQGLLSDSIERANEAWEEGDALQEESEKRYATLDAQINQLNERWKDMKYDIAEILVPVLGQLMDVLDDLIAAWKDLDPEQQQAIIRWIGVAAILGPIASIAGRILGMVVNFITFFRELKALQIGAKISGIAAKLDGISKLDLAGNLAKLGPSLEAFLGQDVAELAASGAGGAGTVFATAFITAVAAYGISNKLAQMFSSAIGDDYMASLYEKYSGFAGFFQLCNDTVTTAAEELEDALSRNIKSTDDINRETRDFIESVDDELTKLDEVKARKEQGIESDDRYITKTGELTGSIDKAASSFEHLHPILKETNDVQDEMPEKIKKIKDEYGFLKGPIDDVTNNSIHNFMEENKKVDEVVKDTAESFEHLHPVVQDVAKEEENTSEKVEELKEEFTFLKDPIEDTTQKTFPNFKVAMQEAQKEMDNTGETAKNLGDNIVSGVQEPIENSSTDGSVKGFFSNLWESFKRIFGISSPAKEMNPIGQFILDGIVEGFAGSFDDFTKGITDFYEKSVKPWFEPSKWSFTGVAEGLNKTFDDGNKQADTFSENMNTQGKNSSTQLLNGVIEGARKTPETMRVIGNNIVTGVWNGIVSAKSKFINDVKGFFSGIVDSVKSGLKIHSPSQVFADEVGQWIPLGILEGVKETMPLTTDEISDIIDDGMKEVSPDVELDTSFDNFVNSFQDGFTVLLNWFETIEERFINSINNMAESMSQINDTANQLTNSYSENINTPIEFNNQNPYTDMQVIKDMLQDMVYQMSQIIPQTSDSVSGGDIVIPVYLGTDMIDEVIVTAQQRNNYRSGGR